ncbi:MAG: Sapep family Mn(2+)-dependent dipeptidase [Oscillospiraceae bacterium]|nr:Sapep family Mn(2+)-dependent dipeptidase [Oscillospiraceae bacterium]
MTDNFLFSALDSYREDILSDLSGLIKIKSVADKNAVSPLFGEEAQSALSFILLAAERLGFRTKNFGGVGYAEYGEGEQYAAVLTHVDVVEAGEGWSSDPFELTERSGFLFGRGVVDDKGAAVVSLYCMKVLSDNGVVGNRRLRCIFGAGEEIGMEDMELYFSSEPPPETAFTPDSDYPVCNREKGILQFEVSIRVDDRFPLSDLTAGGAINCVCESTAASFSPDFSYDYNSFEGIFKGDNVSSSQTEEGGVLLKGKSSHAMNPECGVNSLAALLRVLSAVSDSSSLQSAAELFGCDTNGGGLRVQASDLQSGELTMNLGYGKLSEGLLTLGADIRYPVTMDGKRLIEDVENVLAENGYSLNILEHKPPVYMDEWSELVTLLSRCYERVTGDTLRTYSTGGGTYARSLGGRGLAFGPAFPDEPPTNIHEANENISVEGFWRHARICLLAMKEMIML